MILAARSIVRGLSLIIFRGHPERPPLALRRRWCKASALTEPFALLVGPKLAFLFSTTGIPARTLSTRLTAQLISQHTATILRETPQPSAPDKPSHPTISRCLISLRQAGANRRKTADSV